MKFRIEPRGGHLLAELQDRESAADMPRALKVPVGFNPSSLMKR